MERDSSLLGIQVFQTGVRWEKLDAQRDEFLTLHVSAKMRPGEQGQEETSRTAAV